MTEKMNLFSGQLLSDQEFKEKFEAIKDDQIFWSKVPLSHNILFNSCQSLVIELSQKGRRYEQLLEDLMTYSDLSRGDGVQQIQSLFDFINTDQLRLKLKRELGSEYPFELKRISPKDDHFEAWYPLGILVHVTPNNSPLLGVFAVIEGLLSGNVNLLKLARRDGKFAVLFFKALIEHDSTKTLEKYIYVAKISSSDKQYLKNYLSVADVVSAWGSEESIKSIRELAPSHARIVDWGHKISFAFVSQKGLGHPQLFESLAYEICTNNQMACSSPQCLFVEGATLEELKIFAKSLGKMLDKIGDSYPLATPNPAEQAELTISSEQVRLSSVWGKSHLWASQENKWRLYVDSSPTLTASPLFRTLWIKPIEKKEIVQNIRPLKPYLQSVGVWIDASEVEEISSLFFKSGVQRIRRIGEMLDSYVGEPHDGVYALERFCQKISFSDGKNLKMMESKFSFEESNFISTVQESKIMEKSDFQKQKVDDLYSQLFFYSGGSSGEPKLSIFTYEDYHRQMELAAEGLYAAGFEPKSDRAMNLFYAGNLYGGFVSFFTILEKLNATQFPMGASIDFEMVGKSIVDNKVDCLLGMPSYLNQLFSANKSLFKSYRGIKKIFYGGEHFSLAQRQYLIDEFGVVFVRSASYGSVDAGPLGYQCPFSHGGIHHLHQRLHDLEVVELDQDKPVNKGEVGRLLFSSKVRHGQSLKRYAIGDVGRILDSECGCGRKGVRFELLGRHGDVFRIGTIFLSYQRFEKVLLDHLVYDGSFQIHLYSASQDKNEYLLIKMLAPTHKNLNPIELKQLLLEHYQDLNVAVVQDKVLDIDIQYVSRELLETSNTTKKLKTVIDHRI